MSNWIIAAEGVIAAAVPAAGFVYTYTVNRRAQYERILTLTAQATTPPIADDRHLIGGVFEPTSKFPPDNPVELGDTEIKALYNVLVFRARRRCLPIAAPATVAEEGHPCAGPAPRLAGCWHRHLE